MKDLKDRVNLRASTATMKIALHKAINGNSSFSLKEKASLLKEINSNEKVSLSLYKYLLNQSGENQNITTAVCESFKKAAIGNNLKVIKFILATKSSYITNNILRESLNLLLTSISPFDYQIYGVTFGRSLDIEKRKPAAIEILKRLSEIPKFDDKFLQNFVDKCVSEISLLEVPSEKLKTS